MRIRVPCSTANLGSGIDCLGIALNRYLTVHASVAAQNQFSFGSGFMKPITERDNLFLAAIKQVCQAVGEPELCVNAQMDTEIPASRGLASSASAIVAGVLFANEALGRPLLEKELIDLAAKVEGHPDNVVPCMLGGFTAASMQGTHVIYTTHPICSEIAFVAAVPDFTLATHDARAVLPTHVSLVTAVSQLQRACVLTAALSVGRWELIQDAMRDDVFTPARKHLISGFDDVYQAALDNGALGVMLSGAGPTLIAISRDGHISLADAMREAFAIHQVHAETQILFADNTGATVITE